MDHSLKIKKTKKIQETEDLRYIYQNESDKACFQHDMAYGDFKDLHRRTFADKFLCDKAFDIAKDPKYDGYHRELASMVYKFFNKKTSGSSIKKNISNKELAEELHKSIIRIFNKKSTPIVYRYICSADPADMQLISKFNKGIRFSWVISLKDKKELQLLILFKKS